MPRRLFGYSSPGLTILKVKAAMAPAAICAIQYGITSLAGHLPRRKTASVTAGLRCPPEMCPVAKTMTMSEAPIASGAMTPAAPGMTVQPTVRTRKNVPINSAIYLFIAFGLGVGGAWLHLHKHHDGWLMSRL